jgi:hypothetical protein
MRKIPASQGIMDVHELLSDTLSSKREQLAIERETKPDIRVRQKLDTRNEIIQLEATSTVYNKSTVS